MPNFNNLATAAMTPGGVMSGVNDLVRSILDANARRDAMQAQTAQAGMQSQLAQAGLGMQNRQLNQNQSQFDAQNKRLTAATILDHIAAQNKARSGGSSPDTAIREAARFAMSTDETDKVTNMDPKTNWKTAELTQRLSPEELAARQETRYNRYLQLVGAGGAQPQSQQPQQGGSMDPGTAAILQQLASGAGLEVRDFLPSQQRVMPDPNNTQQMGGQSAIGSMSQQPATGQPPSGAGQQQQVQQQRPAPVAIPAAMQADVAHHVNGALQARAAKGPEGMASWLLQLKRDNPQLYQFTMQALHERANAGQ